MIPRQSSTSSATPKNVAMDLLSMMKSADNFPAKTDPANVSNGWAQREQKVTLTTIKCNERSKSLNADIRGWRNVDGEKTYTTFRNGKVVSASGFEGFKLASGDKPKSKAVKETNVEQQNLGLKRKASAIEVTLTSARKQQL